MLRKCAASGFVILIWAQVSTSVVINRQEQGNENGGPATLPTELFQPIVAPTEKPLHIAAVNNNQQTNTRPITDDRRNIESNNEQWRPNSNGNTQFRPSPNQNNFNGPFNDGVRTFEYSAPTTTYIQYSTNPNTFQSFRGNSRPSFNTYESNPNFIRTSTHFSGPTEIVRFSGPNGRPTFSNQQIGGPINNDISLDYNNFDNSNSNGRLREQNFGTPNLGNFNFGNSDGGGGGGSSSRYFVRGHSWSQSSDMDKPQVRTYEYDSRDGIPRESFFK